MHESWRNKSYFLFLINFFFFNNLRHTKKRVMSFIHSFFWTYLFLKYNVHFSNFVLVLVVAFGFFFFLFKKKIFKFHPINCSSDANEVTGIVHVILRWGWGVGRGGRCNSINISQRCFCTRQWWRPCFSSTGCTKIGREAFLKSQQKCVSS